MITHIDHHIGHIFAFLKDQGLYERTVILFTSDHGDYNGDHGLLRKGSHLYEGILHVPMLVRLPGESGAGRIFPGMTQHEDIAPTILELAGLEMPQSIQGYSFKRILEGASEGLRRYAYFEHSSDPPVLGIRKNSVKLVRYPVPEGLVLTDLSQDPGEYENLINHESHRGLAAELEEQLLSRLPSTAIFRLPKTHMW
jgi:arylsulfatase A-like enzyme